MDLSQLADVGVVTGSTVLGTQIAKWLRNKLPFTISSRILAVMASIVASVYVIISQDMFTGDIAKDATSLIGLVVGVVFLSTVTYNNLIKG